MDVYSISYDFRQLDETPSETHPETRTALVNCLPLPPVKEYRKAAKARDTGIYYYGIYIREGALEAYAKRVNPEAEKYHVSQQRFYAVDYMRWIVNDDSLDIQIAVLQKRHKQAMPMITERSTARILCLFPFGEEAYKKRMSAENVAKLVDALGCKPDWFEIFFFS